jgi:diaminohydroxyphosphoribosylaminopyrimidine deaminase/5-amino-6-(5-phosphoribosylamino)uracil reductase
MRQALRLARGQIGATWPNPSVGACLVDERGELVGEGVHHGPGSAHAEIVALTAAAARRAQLQDCTLFVTLEPCNHHGRTPPCSEAILRAGVGRVVYACADGNPHVLGGGAERLRAGGVRAELAGDATQAIASELNHAFFEGDFGRRAHVTLKLALSADDRLARRFGRVEPEAQRAITGALAQRRAHRLRAQSSCIVVGRGTVTADRPRLDVRRVPLSAERQAPRPVVLDSNLASEPSALPAGSLIFHAASADARRVGALRAAGCEPCPVPRDAGGLRWSAILAELAARELGVVLVEGGAAVATSLLAAGLADRLHLFRAPWSVGAPAPGVFGLQAPAQYRLLRRRRLGEDHESVYVRGLAAPAAGAAPGSARA